MWLSEEWFSPDGVPGIAVPFYLAHPRLERLERRMMRNVEGGSAESAMRILRHEAGHAIDTAYRLRRRKRWREVFGPASLPYPDTYRARPGSRRYVQHLGEWYAQSHPCEDFAETFAVWLKPNSSWRRTYAQWPAFHKLEFVDELLDGRARRARARAQPRGRRAAEATTSARSPTTIAASSSVTAFTAARSRITCSSACSRANGRTRTRDARARSCARTAQALVSSAMRELDEERYSVEQILRIILERAEKLHLWVRGSRRDALKHTRWMLVYLTRLYAQGESPRLSL